MGPAWVALWGAFALHGLDEALTGFLPLYNATVRAIRARFRFLPIPTFRRDVWLSVLITAVVVLGALSWTAFRHPQAMVLPALVFASVMIGNSLLHLVGSLRMRRILPGAYTAPFVLAAGLWLFARAVEQNR